MRSSERRTRLRIVCFALLFATMCGLPVAGQAPADAPPDASTLQAGDLLWPKRPGAWVPYTSQPRSETEDDEVRWKRERDAHLATLRDKKNPIPEEKERYTSLIAMDYATFKTLYLSDEPDKPQPYGSGHFYVGHVGIVELRNSVPYVIEAVLGVGVRRITYAQWLRDRRGELVWHGRLNNVDASKRERIATKAAEYVTTPVKPYKFWNFDLSDKSGFYCSKLAWLAIYEATGVAPDNNPNPKRALWYSPKRLMRSPHIVLLHNPGNYGQ